jgi:perosamine synthetase
MPSPTPEPSRAKTAHAAPEPHTDRALARVQANTRLSVWPPLSPFVYARPRAALPFPLLEPSCRLFALGRHALWHGLRTLDLHAGDEVLAPAYHHGSEIEVLVRLGLKCRFYAASERLEPVEAELETLLGKRTRALLLIHHLGFPQSLDRWRRWCDEHGLFLIEDAAQAWLAHDGAAAVGSAGDVAVFCLYKTFGLPDGAALVSKAGAAGRPPGRPLRDLLAVARRHGAWAAARFSLPIRTVRAAEPGTANPAEDFALGDPAVGPAPGSTFLLNRFSAEAAARRRSNYVRLLRLLPASPAPPFDVLPDGASPFVFPVETADKHALLSELRAAGIHAFDFWSIGHPVADDARFEGVERRRASTVGLPVHQELRARDLERIAGVTGEALERAGG